MGIFSSISQSIFGPKVDPALQQQLESRGMFSKLADLQAGAAQASTFTQLPGATKETLQFGGLLAQDVKPDDPFEQLSRPQQIVKTIEQFNPAVIKVAGETLKSSAGFLATPVVNLQSLAQGTEPVEEVKLPFLGNVPTFTGTYLQSRKAGLSVLESSLLTTTRAAGDVLITEGFLTGLGRGARAAGERIPVQKGNVVELNWKDIQNITRGERFAGKVEPAKVEAFKKLSQEGVSFTDLLKQKGTIDVRTGQPKSLADLFFEQYQRLKGDVRGGINVPEEPQTPFQKLSDLEKKGIKPESVAGAVPTPLPGAKEGIADIREQIKAGEPKICHNCFDEASKQAGLGNGTIEKGVYVKGAKTREEAELFALKLYGLQDLAKVGKNTHAWNVQDGKILDFHQQGGEVSDSFAYVSEERIKQLKSNAVPDDKLETEITTRIEQFRKDADLLVDKEGAGVRLRNIEDARGEFEFQVKDFKISRAKGRMKSRAEDTKEEASALLYENDPDFRQLVDRFDELQFQQAKEPGDTDIFDGIFDTASEVAERQQFVTELTEEISSALAKKRFNVAQKAKAIAKGSVRGAKAQKALEQRVAKRQVDAERRQGRRDVKRTNRETKEQLVAAFKDSSNQITELVGDTKAFIMKNVPAGEREGLLSSLADRRKTPQGQRKKAFSILDRAEKVIKKVEKAKTISDIKKLKLPARGKENIAVDYQKQINSLFEGVDLNKPTERTTKKLKSLEKFLEDNQEALQINPGLIKKLERLNKTPLKDMDQKQLSELKEVLQHLHNLGKLKASLKNKYNARERELKLKKLEASTKNIDPNVKDKSNLTANEKRKIEIRNGYMRTLHAPRVTDMLDGFKGYDGENTKMVKRLNMAETKAKNTTDAIMEDTLNRIREAGIEEITPEMSRNVTIKLMQQQGATDQVNILLELNNLKEVPELTTKEEFLVKLAQEKMSEFKDQMAAVSEEIENVPFQEIENYFPIKYTEEFNIAPGDSVKQTRNRSTRTFQGFLEARKTGVKEEPRTDFLAVMEEAVNEQQWYMNIQPELENIKPLVLSEEYAQFGGDFAQKFWADYVDVVARRGWSATAKANNFLRRRRVNINQAVLGYKVSTVLMQPFATFDAMAYGQSRFGTKATLQIMKEVSKSWVVPGVTKKTIDGSPTLQQRAGGELAIEESFAETKRAVGLYNKFKKNALVLIQKTDVKTAAGVQSAFEKILKDNNVPNYKQEAEFLMNLTQGSAEVTNRPLILSSGEGSRTWFTFQTFFLNRWGIVAHDLIRGGILKPGIKTRLNALIGLGILMMGAIAEDETRNNLTKLLRGKDYSKDDSRLMDTMMFIPEQVPYFGNAIHSARKFNNASASAPLISIFEDTLGGGMQALTGKKRETKLKGLVKLARGLLAIEFGVPGTFQLAEFFNRLIDADPPGTGIKVKPVKVKPIKVSPVKVKVR